MTPPKNNHTPSQVGSRTDGERDFERMNKRVIYVCTPCLKNKKGECHEPACFFWMFKDSDIYHGKALELMADDFEAHSQRVREEALSEAQREVLINIEGDSKPQFCDGVHKAWESIAALKGKDTK